MLVTYNLVIVLVFLQVGFKDFVYEIQGIYRSQVFVLSLLFRLSHIELGGVEEHTLLEGCGPFHLHLHAELSAPDVLAQYIHDGVLVLVEFRHKFRRQIFNALYLLVVVEW